jgi:hypothetical protein
VIPEGVTTIGRFAFHGCTSLTSIVIPESVTTIGGAAFSACTSLASIVIPESVTTIGDCAFGHCESITSIVIPEGVTTIGNKAFSGCTSLKSIVIPHSVTSIGGHAFAGCTSLTSKEIRNSLTKIGYGAFDECTSLKSNMFQKMDECAVAFDLCASFNSNSSPNSVATVNTDASFDATSIGDECASLTEIVNEINEERSDEPWSELEDRKVVLDGLRRSDETLTYLDLRGKALAEAFETNKQQNAIRRLEEKGYYKVEQGQKQADVTNDGILVVETHYFADTLLIPVSQAEIINDLKLAGYVNEVQNSSNGSSSGGGQRSATASGAPGSNSSSAGSCWNGLKRKIGKLFGKSNEEDEIIVLRYDYSFNNKYRLDSIFVRNERTDHGDKEDVMKMKGIMLKTTTTGEVKDKIKNKWHRDVENSKLCLFDADGKELQDDNFLKNLNVNFGDTIILREPRV